MLQIRCKNNKKTANIEIGSKLSDVFLQFGLEMDFGPITAKVNNKVEGMHFRLYGNKDVEFLDLHSPSGQRAYTRTLFLVLCKAVRDLYPEGSVTISNPVSNGYFCSLEIGREVTAQDVDALRTHIDGLIAAARPIHRLEMPAEDAIALFKKAGAHSKVNLLETTSQLYTVCHELDGYIDYFYGALLTNTSQLHLYGLELYHDGLLLRVPSKDNPAELGPLVNQDKMFGIFREQHRWNNLLGITTVGQFNEAVAAGHAKEIINVSEALQERKIVRIADEIAARPDVKVVLIAGPSSSGKTSTCHRICIQLITNGMRPIPISLDDYFLDRDLTPRMANGDYDFENLHAINLKLLNEQFAALFHGDEVELPRYNFVSGKSEKSGHRLRMRQGDVLVVEGIHALNPELTAKIPEAMKFRVYASALTSIMLDTHNYIPTTDNRLLRRIIRDYKYRGCTARDTIHRWPSVREGEEKWIFPYQENADIMFNTAMIYELAAIKKQALEALEAVPENCDEYSEAYRLRKFLRYFSPISYDTLPSTSLLREFLGGSSIVE